MKPHELHRHVRHGTLVCPACQRPVRILLGDQHGELRCSICFGRKVKKIPV